MQCLNNIACMSTVDTSGMVPDQAARALAGVTVVVTRPVHQSYPLCRLIEAQGGSTLSAPVLEVKPVRLSAALVQKLTGPPALHWLIFISANAARYGMPLLEELKISSSGSRLAAVGPATAAALAEFGRRDILIPEYHYDSQGLLMTDELQRVHGLRIAIFRGRDGKETLAQGLRARGAEVYYLEVYERLPITIAADPLQAIAARADVVTLTSRESLLSWVCAIKTHGLTSLYAKPCVVVSASVGALAREAGLQQVTIAERADDASLLTALCAWRQQRSAVELYV